MLTTDHTGTSYRLKPGSFSARFGSLVVDPSFSLTKKAERLPPDAFGGSSKSKSISAGALPRTL